MRIVVVVQRFALAQRPDNLSFSVIFQWERLRKYESFRRAFETRRAPDAQRAPDAGARLVRVCSAQYVSSSSTNSADAALLTNHKSPPLRQASLGKHCENKLVFVKE